MKWPELGSCCLFARSMFEGLGRRFLCTLPVEDLAEAVKNKTELGLFFASLLFALNFEKKSFESFDFNCACTWNANLVSVI